MADAFEIVSEINAFLTAQKPKTPPELHALASSYAALCRDANARLNRCGNFLRKRLRAEAIYHAEIKPDLLELTSLLDTVAWADWNARCQEHKLELPPPLALDIARELNKAYSVQASMKHLLRQMRKLSLEQAPLRERLHVLRAIAKADPGNGDLEQDLLAFETARHEEIATEAKRAHAFKDTATLNRLRGEIDDEAWKRPVPPRVRSFITDSARGHQVENATHELKAIEQQLHTAYAAQAFDECRGLVEQWDQILAVNQIAPPSELAAQAAGAINWVRGIEQERRAEQEFQVACAELDRALEDERVAEARGRSAMVTATELQKLYRRATGFDRPLPEDLNLTRRFQTRLAELELRRRRRNRALAVVVVIGLVLAGGIVTLVVQRGIARVTASRWATSIGSTLDAGKIDDAQRLWASLETSDPKLTSRSPLPEVKDRLDKAVADRASLKAELATAMETLKQQMESAGQQAKSFKSDLDEATVATAPTISGAGGTGGPGAKPWPRKPDWTHIDTTLQTAEALAERLGDATQKLAVSDLKGELEQSRLDVQSKINEKFNSRLDGVVKTFAGVNLAMLEQDTDGFEKLLASLAQSVNSLSQTPDLGTELRDALNPLGAKLTAWRAALKDHREAQRLKEAEYRDLAGLTKCAAAPATWARAVGDFCKAHPTSPKASAFAQAIQQAEAWACVLDWQSTVQTQWKGELLPAAAADIPGRVQEIDAHLKKYSFSPYQADLNAIKLYLARAQNALSAESPWKKSLPDIMRSPLLQLHSFRADDGKVYYTPRGAKISDDSLGFGVKVQLTDDPQKLTPRRSKTKPDIKPSAQSALATAVLARAGEMSLANWNTLQFEIAESVCAAKDVDPILRAILLDEVIGYMKRDTTWGADEDVDAIQRAITQLPNVRNLFWMDPDNEEANAAKPTVTAALAKAVRAKSLQTRIETSQNQLLARLRPVVRAGALMREGEAWQVIGAESWADGQTLWVLIDAPGGAVKAFSQIGQVVDRKPVIELPRVAGVPEGSMVFVMAGK